MADFDAKPRNRKSWIWVILVVLTLAALIVWQTWPSATTAPKNSRNARAAGGATPVVAVVAQKGDVAITRKALGTITPLANVTVRTQIAGQLMQIAFQEGQIVQEGDFLAQIDPRPYQLALEQAEGSLKRDQALLKEARLNRARYQTLVKQDAIARQQLDTQESLVQQYEGTVATDQSQIDTAKLNLTYCRITAPVGGRVGLRQVDVGNYVQTGDTNGIVTLTQLQPITAIFTLPEDDVPLVMKRQTAGAEMPVAAYDRTLSTKLATGKLSAVDNQIDTTTGTVKLRAQFENSDGSLFPNQFVNIELLIDTLKDATIVPGAAVLRGAPGTFVYLVKPDDTVTVKAVKLGAVDGENIAITEGLNPGDKIVLDGTDKLRDGAKITLPEEKPAADDKTEAGQRKRHKEKSEAPAAPDIAAPPPPSPPPP